MFPFNPLKLKLLAGNHALLHGDTGRTLGVFTAPRGRRLATRPSRAHTREQKTPAAPPDLFPKSPRLNPSEGLTVFCHVFSSRG